MAEIVFDRVGKVYPDGTTAVRGVDLTIDTGEFMVMVGPSGCGKSTMLRMAAGLEHVSSGRIFIGDRDVTRAAPKDRDVAMVFQNYALYPHMSVRDNLGFSLKVSRTPKAEIRQRVDEVARLLELQDLLKRKPAQLSGGQRQRVAMGRAIVREPSAFLMDEPLSNLDAKLRVGMRGELANLHRRLGVTTLYVTHDQVEAMTLGQRVAVIDKGLLQQVDSPQEIYRNPKNVFVAAFIGSPSMNLVKARVTGESATFGQYHVRLDTSQRSAVGERSEVILGIRPEHLIVAPESASDTFEVDVQSVEHLGSEAHVFFSINAAEATLVSDLSLSELDVASGGAQAAQTRCVARVPTDTDVGVGGRLRLRIVAPKVQIFDVGTGESLSAAH